ncbi:MAG: TRAP transporter large permease subunit [Alphaproteobacteria bacterium]|nr:TRAP transporter large permease subunit [Alphaproteobacteria bacterium]
MEVLIVAATVLGLLVLFLGSGTWIFAGLLGVSIVSLSLLLDFDLHRTGVVLSSIALRASRAWELSAIPLFIWMGEILFKADFSSRLFRGLAPLVDRLPGRLLHTNVLGCTIFAAVSGSSAATTATIGRITFTELSRRGYSTKLAVGSLAGAGSLGLLIPPSILMIVYGVLAEVSITKLFAAGIFPGLLLAGFFVAWVMIRCVLDPSLAPADQSEGGSKRNLLRVLGGSVIDLAPIMCLIVTVLGGIYSGLVTPSEAAAVGCALSLLMTALYGKLSYQLMRDSLLETVVVSSMILSILVAAAFLSTALGYLHLPQDLAIAIAGLGLHPLVLLAAIAVFYILIGMIMDGVSLTVMTLPIILPIIIAAGFDPLWFGVFLIILVEMGQVTPPVGFNLYVLQGVTGKSLAWVARAASPFFLLMCAAAAVLAAFPKIALFLPSLMK